MVWSYKGKFVSSMEDVPEGAIGFIYKICDGDQRCYIGKKSLFSLKNKEVSKNVYDKAKSEGKKVLKTKNKAKSKSGVGGTVWRYKVEEIKESNWLTYNSSNLELKKRKDISVREIIDFAYSKQELTYLETKYQMQYSVLESDSWYNDNILGKFFSGVINKNK